MAFFGPVVVPAEPPLVLDRTFSAAELRTHLEGAVAAHEGRLSPALLGTDRIAASLDRPPGTSLDLAAIAGVGFVHDQAPWLSAGVRAGLESEDPARRARAARLAARKRGSSNVYKQQLAHLRVLVERSSTAFALELHPEIEGTIPLKFEVAWRRRLAYALAFDATLAVNSLRPLEERTQAMATGFAVDRLVGGAGLRQAFSLTLNLVARLDTIRAYEEKTGEAHPEMPARVANAGRKRETLRRHLAELSSRLAETLSVDGRIAVAALISELDEAAESGWHGPLHRWWASSPARALYDT